MFRRSQKTRLERFKGAMNQPADVETVQNMLRQVAMILSEPRFDPGAMFLFPGGDFGTIE